MVRCLLLAAYIGFWYLFLQAGPFAAVQTHFTTAPEKYPEFRLTPWGPDPGLSAIYRQPVLAREAVYRLTFFTLRYSQLSLDAGATTEVYRREADVRWVPTGLAMVASAVLLVLLYWCATRLVSRRPEHSTF